MCLYVLFMCSFVITMGAWKFLLWFPSLMHNFDVVIQKRSFFIFFFTLITLKLFFENLSLMHLCLMHFQSTVILFGSTTNVTSKCFSIEAVWIIRKKLEKLSNLRCQTLQELPSRCENKAPHLSPMPLFSKMVLQMKESCHSLLQML